MIGLVVATLSGFLYCLGSILLRRGMVWSGESYTAVPISVFVGVIVSGFAVLVTGQAGQLLTISWHTIIFFAASGVVHFILGRTLAYTAIRLIGANRTNPITSNSTLVSVFTGILFLGEPLTAYLGVAVVLILTGVIFIGRTGGAGTKGSNVTSETVIKGVFISLGAAFCWGFTPLLTKVGLQEGASPVMGVFIAYIAASIMISFSLLYQGNRQKIRQLSRNTLAMLGGVGIMLTLAHLFRYTAIDLAPISMVSPIFISTSALFVFPLSFLINREIEVFNRMVITGAVLIATGILLIFFLA